MSIAIKINNLSKERQEDIISNNVMKPINNFNAQDEWKEEKDNTFPIYRTITLNDERVVLVPLYFGLDYAKKHQEIKVVKNDFHFKGRSYNFRGTLRDYQEQAVNQIKKDFNMYGTSTLSLYASAGKTITASYVFSGCDGILAVVVHMETLLPQWVNTFLDFTDAKIHVVGEKKNKWSIEESNVWIVMEQRINKLVSEGISDWVSMVIVDEAHFFCCHSRAQNLLGFRPKYMIMLTATPEKDNGLHEVMYSFVGKKQICKSYQITFDVHCINTNILPKKESNKCGDGLNFSVFTQSLLYNKTRNTYVTNLVDINRGRKILILTKEKEHVDLLSNMMSERGIKNATMMGKNKTYVDSDVLIGTVSKIGCGFDEASFCSQYNGRRLDLLIFMCSYRNKSTIEQSVGRVLRSDNPVIIYLRDKDNICDRHWKIFKDWAEQNKGKCLTYKVDLDNYYDELLEFNKRPISKIVIKRPYVRLWLEKWGENFHQYTERTYKRKEKKAFNPNRVYV